MGCNCGKSRTVGNKKISTTPNSKNLIKIGKRYKECSKCSNSVNINKRIITRRKKTLVKKRCKKLNILIDYIASNFNFSCPLKKF